MTLNAHFNLKGIHLEQRESCDSELEQVINYRYEIFHIIKHVHDKHIS